MGSWLFDVIAGTALDYPTVPGDGSVDPNVDPRSGVLAKWFAPKLTQYPRPAALPSSLGGITDVTIASARFRALLDALAVAGITPSPTPVAGGASAPSSGPSSVASLSDALLLHLLMSMAPRDPGATASTPVVIAPTSVPTAPATASVVPATPVATTPVAATPATPASISPAPVLPVLVVPSPTKIKTTFRAWSLNPDFVGPGIATLFDSEGESRHDELSEDVLSMLLESQSVDSDPLTFNVPDGCNAVEILAGPIETVPGAGTKEDLDLPAFTGRARVLANGCDCSVDRLHPGDELTVIVPWRASGAISLPSGRLRQLVHVHFFKGDAPTLAPCGASQGSGSGSQLIQ